jgi:cobalt-zinc-cadmium efflux system outer membrane protein
VAIVLLVGEAQAIEPPVMVEQAVQHAVARPALAASLASEVAVEDAEGVAAWVWPNPEVGYEREQLFGGGESEDVVVLSQSLEISGQRGLRAAAAVRRGDAARLDAEATRRRTAVEARRRFWVVAFQQARHAVAGAWLIRLQSGQTLVSAREDAGEGSAYDALRMDREVRRARLDLGRVAVDREGAWLDLLALTGPLKAPQIWPRVAGDLVPSEAEERTADVAERPDLQAWARRSEAAGIEAKAAGRGWIPEVGLAVGWKSVNAGDTRENGFAGGVSLSIPIFDHGQGDEARALAARARADAIRALLVEDATRLERPAEDRARRLTALARSARDETETAARELQVTAQAAWLAGELDLLELLDVHRGTRDDGLALLELEHAAREARETLRLITLEEVP